MQSKVSDEITYPFLNFNGAIVEVWEWISVLSHIVHWVCAYLSMLSLKLIRVSKRGYLDRQELSSLGVDYLFYFEYLMVLSMALYIGKMNRIL